MGLVPGKRSQAFHQKVINYSELFKFSVQSFPPSQTKTSESRFLVSKTFSKKEIKKDFLREKTKDFWHRRKLKTPLMFGI